MFAEILPEIAWVGKFWEDWLPLIQVNEAQFEHPWSYQLPEEYLEKMMRGIVGFAIPISRLEGKYKMSQNRNANEQARVVDELQESNPEVANVMRDVRRRKPGS